MVMYMLVVLIIISSLTASITSFLAADQDLQFLIFDAVPSRVAQVPGNLEVATDSKPAGSLVLQAGSTTEAYARDKLKVDVSTNAAGEPVLVEHLNRISAQMMEVDLMEAVILDPKYLAFLTYTGSLEAYRSQDETRAREFRKQHPDKLFDARATSQFCNERWSGHSIKPF